MANESTAEQVRYLEPAERPTALKISDALRSFVDFVGRWGVLADHSAGRHHRLRRDRPQAGLDSDLAGREPRPDLRIDAAAGAGMARPHRAVRARAGLRLHLEHPRAGRSGPRDPRVPQEGVARASRAHLLHDPLLPDRDLVRLDLRAQFVRDQRDLRFPGRPKSPLDHQERPGVRADRCRALRRGRVAAGGDRALGAAEHPVPA